MKPIDLKELYGSKYQVGHDEAAKHEPGGLKDPWLYIIPCRYGHIYPHSSQRLAVFCDRPRLFERIETSPGVSSCQEGDGESVFLFPASWFDAVARVVHPRKKRRLSEAHREALVASGRSHRFQTKTTVPRARKIGQERGSLKEPVSEPWGHESGATIIPEEATGVVQGRAGL